MKHQLCCIEHITLDKAVTPASTVCMPGGTAFYCSYAVSLFKNIDYTLVTSIGDTEMKVVNKLCEAGMSPLKTEKSGPFCGIEEDVIRCINTAEGTNRLA